jgi:hypothetical protein
MALELAKSHAAEMGGHAHVDTRGLKIDRCMMPCSRLMHCARVRTFTMELQWGQRWVREGDETYVLLTENEQQVCSFLDETSFVIRRLAGPPRPSL